MANFVRWNLTEPGVSDSRRVHLVKLIARGDKLWAQVVFTPRNESVFDGNTQDCFLEIDPASGSTRKILFPESLGFIDGGFEVSDEALYVCAGRQIRRYDLKHKGWQTIPIPTESGAQLVALKEQLYVATAEGLIEVELGTEPRRSL